MDLLMCLASIFLAFLLRYNFNLSQLEFSRLQYVVPFYFLIRLVTFKLTRTYAGIIRFTSLEDAKRIFVAVTVGSLFLAFFNTVFFYFKGMAFLPFSVVVIDYFIALLALTSFRIAIKIFYHEVTNLKGKKKNVVIYGAGRSGLITKRTLDHDGQMEYRVIAFLDDDLDKKAKTLEGVNIYNSDQLHVLAGRNSIDHLIISIQDISIEKKQQIIDECLKYNIKVKTVPPVNTWINGELSLKQIKTVRIEDLLEREPIDLDRVNVERYVKAKTVLITGASGSIGSELVRQIIKFYPEQIILLDQAETPLYEIEMELNTKYKFANYQVVLGNITNVDRMREIFRKYEPNIVFHVAAYKHVPLMEEHPCEAVLTNVLGTRTLADLAVEFEVGKFVMISTDKAVNPTNVMGASKRLAEIYIQSLNEYLTKSGKSRTRFITTRFGNVLGSNGSVIPLFRKQILNGGPITVTHPEITRYFMTIPEACQLILEAGSIGKGGEIFIFDMGDAVKIVDLARKMIKLSGFTPGKDIQITYSGLRPGEKLFEELLNNKENTLPTHHPKILIAKVREYSYELISRQIDEIITHVNKQDEEEVVFTLKRIIPEYLSQNSRFSVMDKSIKAPLEEAYEKTG